MAAIIARLIGGAGTGKTTELMNLMGATIEAGIRDPTQIGFVSFTRAARLEAATRAAKLFGIDRAQLERNGWFRTLHSVCFRCLGCSNELLSGDKASADWLAEALQEQVTVAHDSGESDLAEIAFASDTRASRALNIWSAARNRLVPLQPLWLQAKRCDDSLPSYEYCVKTVERYEQAKRLGGRLDFTDLLCMFAGKKCMVDEVLEREPQGYVPALPVWFFDEQQDASPLLDAVSHRLISTPECKWVYVVGDPFQSIYGWAGADPRCFRAWPVAKEKIMPKSYRCPAQVLQIGERTLRRCSDYFDRGIAPADHEGKASSEWGLGTLDLVNPDSEWLVLARTNMLADRLAQVLERRGVPWVPTRGRGGWNAPVRNLGLAGLWTLEQGGPISGAEWRQVLKLLPSKIPGEGVELLTRGTKTRFDDEAECANYEWVLPNQLAELGATPQLSTLIAEKRWRSLVKDGTKVAQALDRFGVEVLAEPKIKVGTIHSVKGQEADNVILLATTSSPVARNQEQQQGFDEERRVEYVGATRARRRLYVVKERGATNAMEID